MSNQAPPIIDNACTVWRPTVRERGEGTARLPADAALYFNFSQIGNNAFEFIFEFGQLYPEANVPVIQARVVTGPTYAREFLDLLRQSIERYEQAFGVIRVE